MEKFFHLKENGTTVSTEIIAGLTTFFAMSYIIFVNPNMLSQTGMPFGAVFLATIFASVVGTLVMGLFANVPYAQAPGMGLNAFFTFTVVFALGFTWQEALAKKETRAPPRRRGPARETQTHPAHSAGKRKVCCQ